MPISRGLGVDIFDDSDLVLEGHLSADPSGDAEHDEGEDRETERDRPPRRSERAFVSRIIQEIA